ALQEAGWFLRQDIIWSKPNPMPESVRDRCTKAHEYIFLLTKSPRYYYDNDAIKEPIKDSSIARLSQDIESQIGSDRVPGKTNGNMKACMPQSWKGSSFNSPKTAEHQLGRAQKDRDRTVGNRNGLGASTLDRKDYKHRGTGDQKLTGHSGNYDSGGYANKRSVWTVS